MNYDKVKQIAQLASDCALASSVMGGGNQCIWDDYESLSHILLAKDDPNLKYAMKHSGHEFEITETMTSEDGWKKFRQIENSASANDGGEGDSMVTWDGYQI